MKKLILLIIAIIGMICFSGYTVRDEVRWTNKQIELHEIANRARELGIPEDSPIIVELQRLWWQEQEDLRILAKVVRNESGYCTDRHQQLVAKVVLNRVASPMFPDNVKDVVNAPMQYNPIYTRDLPDWDTTDPETLRAFRNALKAMNGEVECPSDVFFQSEFPKLGKGNYETITVDTGWFRSTTYFNYG